MALSARILGVEGFGVLGVIAATTVLVYGLAAMPGRDVVTTFVTRAVVEGRAEEGARVFRFALASSLGFALIAYVVIAALALAASDLLEIDEEHKNAMLLYGVGGVLTAVYDESLGALRLADRMLLYLLVTIVARLVGVGLLAAVWLAEGGLTEVVLAHMAVSAVSGLGMFAAAALSAPQAGLAGFLRSASLKIPPDVARFTGTGFWESKITALVDNIDIILLARFTGAADAGLYRAARRIVDVGRLPIGLMPHAMSPEYSRQWYSGQGAELRRAVFRMTIMSMTLAVAGLGLLALFREPIIRLFLGDAFSGASSLLLILILGALPVAAAFRMLPSATGRIWSPLLSRIAGLAVFLVGMAWLAPAYGAAGVAWARTMFALVSLLAITPFVILILRQSYGLSAPKGEGEADSRELGLP